MQNPEAHMPPKAALSRKNVLCLASSVLLALFIMLAAYLHWLPTRNIHINIQAAELKDGQARGNETRLLYVIVDDDMVLLDKFAVNGWQYQGSLVSWGSGAVDFKLPARRYVELAFRQSPTGGLVEITKDGEKKTHDLYIKEGDKSKVIRYNVNNFLSLANVLIGLFSLVVLYNLFYALLGKRPSPYWDERLPAEEPLMYAGIFLAAVLSMMVNCHRPFSWHWVAKPDIAVFLAAAKLFLMGLVPYAEVWDHKGPMVFFFNALGVKIWYPYGAWILETLLQMAGFSFCYLFLKCRFSKLIAFGATLMAAAVFVPLQGGGGTTESWSLPFIFMSAYIFARAFKNGCKVSKLGIVLCGGACAIVLLFRVNIAILWCAAVPLLMVNQIIRRNMALLARQTGWFALGFGGVMIPVCLYFLSKGALKEMIDATVIFNMHYAQSSNSDLSAQLNNSINLLSSIKFPYFRWLVAIGFVYPVICLMRSGKKKDDGRFEFELNYFLIQALYTSVFLLVGTMSGRPFHHYLIPGIPVFAMASSYALEFFHSLYLRFESKGEPRGNTAAATCMVVLYAYLIWPVYLDILQQGIAKKEFDMMSIEQLAVANYIMANTPEHSFYGSWGGFGGLHTMMRDRKPAIRFFYVYDLIVTPDNKAGRKNFEVLMRDVEENGHKYFVLLRYKTYLSMPPEFEAYLHEHYTPVEMFQNYYVRLYERKN